MQKKWLYSSMAVSALTLSVLAACSGDNGSNGKDGTDGENGTSCTVESLSDSSGYKILCGGDSVGVLLNGTDGDNGANGRYGSGCYIEPFDDSTGYDVYCNEKKVGTLVNGEDGANGESCTAKSVDGGYELTCGDSVIGTIKNGTGCVAEESSSGNGFDLYCAGKLVGTISDGTGCTVVDNGNGTVTQTCGEDEVIIYKALCGSVSYDPTKYACEDNTVKKYCFKIDEKTGDTTETTAYDTTTHYCHTSGEVRALGTCGEVSFEEETQYCSKENTVEEKVACGSAKYNPELQYCTSADEVVEDLAVCEITLPNGSGSMIERYNPEAYYCATDNSVSPAVVSVAALSKCGKKLFNPELSYCSEDKEVIDYGFCNGVKYSPATKYCEDNQVIDKIACGEEEDAELYNPNEKYCSKDGEVKDLARCGAEGATGNLYNPELTICDIRDYNLYNYTTIGNQVWTATDMKYSGQSGSSVGTTNNQFSSARYYNWSEAMGLESTYQNSIWNENKEGEGIQGVCPNGWHIPSLTEVNALRAYLGKKYEGCENGEGECGQALKALGWDEGTDEYGFSATNTGYGYSGNWNSTNWAQNGFYMWTSMQSNDNADGTKATRFSILDDATTFTQTTAQKSYRFPVRCIKD
jgi:uncharacterized protein (TIGR02145 family)